VNPLFTIGYERTTPDAVLGELKRARIRLLVDTRAVAASRRPGFSKRQLAAALDDIGIGYLHLRGLGTPAEGRQAARSGDFATLRRVYEAHVEMPGAQQELDELTALARRDRLCLLCYERDPAHCHRSRIAELVRDRIGVEIKHLIPAPL
jgi:uncharacterized protein (DUF488 family)